MAETFKNVRALLADSATDVYTVPAGTVAIVIGAQVANIGSGSNELDFWWTDASAADAITRLGSKIVVPTAAAYEPIGGKLVLEAGDKLRGESENDQELEATVSVLEIS
jgi:hypothetical protein